MRRLRPEEGAEIPVSFLCFEHREVTLWISRPLPRENFPPCISNILSSQSTPGAHRAAAVLAAFLGQAGWGEEEAVALWRDFASRCRLDQEGDNEARIFHKWFAALHCPSCRTIKSQSRGYPHLGLAGLGYCQPDPRCPSFDSPVNYAAGIPIGQSPPPEKGRTLVLGTEILVRLYDWTSGREETVELSPGEKKALEELLQQQGEGQLVFSRVRVRGRLCPCFQVRPQDGPRRSLLSDDL
ncbi:MAG: hypothetical protein GKC10_04150 [Methanosarcinales archaeon]|nr:hypothetical protein [Methanosarcinales archaeon]